MFWVVNDVGKLSGSLEFGGSAPGNRLSSNASTIKVLPGKIALKPTTQGTP